jgi:transcription antitermination factor NusA-like protein
MPVTTDQVYVELQKRLRRRSPGELPALRSIRVGEPADGIAEISAVIRQGERHRAVAVRLEGIDGRWRCTALQLG